MDDIQIRAEACVVCNKVMDNTPSQADCVGYAAAGIRRGIELERALYRETDAQIDRDNHRDRRDRFIAAALMGLCARGSYDELHMAKFAVEAADAVLALLDNETNEATK